MAQKYSVDWSDPPYPQIIKDEFAAYPNGYTFAKAKQEIVEHFQYRIDDAKDSIRRTRALRVADVENNTEE